MSTSLSDYLAWAWKLSLEHLPNLIIAVIILFIGWIIAKLVKNILIKTLDKTNADKIAQIFIAHTLYVLIVIIAIISALSKLGVPTASMIAIISVVGLGFSMGMRSSIGNLSSGALLAIFRPFKVGDFVDIGGTTGTVLEVKLLFTVLKTSDNKETTIPNNLTMTRIMTNFSANDTRRADIVIGIGYEDDLKKAKQILTNLITDDDRILKEEGKEPLIVVKEFADSSVNLLMRYWSTRADFMNIQYDLLENIKLTFDEQGISIPYPQRDVHLYREDKIANSDKVTSSI